MPLIKDITTKSAKSVWTSPDGKIQIFELEMEWQGKPVKANTYSTDIAVPGWTGEVETYEKAGKGDRPAQTFVKQPQKENSYSGGKGGYSKPQGDPFTMYLSYAKDIGIACIATDNKGDMSFNEKLYSEMLEAVSAGGAQLYDDRPELGSAGVKVSEPKESGLKDSPKENTDIEPTVTELNEVLGGELLTPEEDPWKPKKT